MYNPLLPPLRVVQMYEVEAPFGGDTLTDLISGLFQRLQTWARMTNTVNAEPVLQTVTYSGQEWSVLDTVLGARYLLLRNGTTGAHEVEYLLVDYIGGASADAAMPPSIRIVLRWEAQVPPELQKQALLDEAQMVLGLLKPWAQSQ